MLSVSQPRTHPLIALFGLGGIYLITALVLMIWPVGRTVGLEYVLVMTVVTALAMPAAAVLSGVHLIARDHRMLLEALVPVLLPPFVAPIITVVVFFLLPSCNRQASLLLFALGPHASAVLIIALVALIGRLVSRPILLAAIVYLVILSSGALTLWRLYWEPPTLFLNHFFGAYYPIIYDKVAGVDSRIITYRCLTWLWGLGGLFLARTIVPRRGNVVRRAPAWAALFLLSGAFLSWIWGDQLYPTRSDVERALGKKVVTPHFEIYLDRLTEEEEIRRIAEDHEFRYWQIEELFGSRLPQGAVQSFVYPSAQRKAELIGAAGTQLAAPWLLEMHTNASGFPHPVLAHELVHVLSAAIGSGPFRTSARFSLLPQPGYIEGLAVALEPDVEEVPLLDQARALKQLGYLPSLEQLGSATAFWTEAPSRAYVGAGSLFQFLFKEYGVVPVATFYTNGDFSVFPGTTPEEIEKGWHAMLDREPASAHAMAIMRRRFERKALFDERCVHARSTHFKEVRQTYNRGQRQQALEKLREMHDDNPDDIDIARLLLRYGLDGDDPSLIDEACSWISISGDLTAAERISAESGRGDVAWRGGDERSACHSYQQLQLSELSSQMRRLLLVKQFACEWRPAEDEAVHKAVRGIMSFLVGRGPESAGSRSDLIALQHLRSSLAQSEHPIAQACDGLLAYLIGLQLVRQDPHRAAALLDECLAMPSFDDELLLSARYHRAMARYLAGQLKASAADFEVVAQSPVVGPYSRRALDFLQRISFDQNHKFKLEISEIGEE